jgi:hypothetical protein
MDKGTDSRGLFFRGADAGVNALGIERAEDLYGCIVPIECRDRSMEEADSRTLQNKRVL